MLTTIHICVCERERRGERREGDRERREIERERGGEDFNPDSHNNNCLNGKNQIKNQK